MSLGERERQRRADPEDDAALWAHLNGRARIEGEEVYLPLLEDRMVWNRCPSSLQDRAIAAVARALPAAFSPANATTFSCGGQRHRIAAFRHRLGFTLNLIPGGAFSMGSATGLEDSREEEPRHGVVIRGPFLMAIAPVSRRLWSAARGLSERSAAAMDQVGWDQIQTWLNLVGDGLRLPSEAEWEYAARAGTDTDYCFGSRPGDLSEYGWSLENAAGQAEVPAQKKPNAFGLYDVHGNVAEWCQDAWIDNYIYGPDTEEARGDPNDHYRVVRGGNAATTAAFCASASRDTEARDAALPLLGFRPAAEVPGPWTIPEA